MSNSKVVLITGAAKRVGATVARYLHAQGMRLAIHYHHSAKEADNLCAELNSTRPHSAIAWQGDLNDTQRLPQLISYVIDTWGQLDVLINNASSFYSTPLKSVTEEQWHDLLGTNLKATFFLAQAAIPYLTKQQGCMVNMLDIQASNPLPSYPVYCIAKAGLTMLTKSLAKELGPQQVRVNGIAPGVVLWPDDQNEFDTSTREKIIARTALKRAGTPQDIAKTIAFLIQDANYITGQIISVDGGRSLAF
jgi:pteridine reductase